MDGYIAAIDWRFVSGKFDEPGPCAVSARPRLPLIPGEELSPTCRTMLVADSGSGVSMTHDPVRATVANPDAARAAGHERRLLADERALRSAVRPPGPGLTVLTGGQTGIDSYAAAAALGVGLTVHLVFPRGLRQEDGPLTPQRRRELHGAILHELTSDSFEYRTWTCVYLSDVVLLLDPAGGAGCLETARAATKLGRPLMAPGPGELTAEGTARWLTDTRARVLMVAGCRASVLASQGLDGAAQRADLHEAMAGARSVRRPPSAPSRS